MTGRDLQEVRLQVRQRQERAAEVERRRQLMANDHEEHRGLTLRCEKKHSGGKMPKIAEVHSTKYGVFFSAAIPWAPSDATTLRPWIEDSYLSDLLTGAMLEDDAMLTNTLDNLAWWKQRGPGDLGWIAERKGRSHRIFDVLDLPFTTGRPVLWVRCPTHLEDFEVVQPTRILAALR